jgi:hypothetical protein
MAEQNECPSEPTSKLPGVGDLPRPKTKRGGGPQTEEGKRRSRMNATKHGLTSRIPVSVGEDSQELNELHEDFRIQLQPVGAAEEAAVDAIVNGVWRKRRANRHEALLMDATLVPLVGDSRLVSADEALLDNLDCEIEAAHAFLMELDDWDDTIDFNATEVENALYLPLVLCFHGSPPRGLRYPKEPERWSVREIWAWFEEVATNLCLTGRRAVVEVAIDEARRILDARRRRKLDQEALKTVKLYKTESGFELLLRYESKIEREITNGYKQLMNLQRSRREREDGRESA